MTDYNADEVIRKDQIAELLKEGWKEVPGNFALQ